MHQAKCEKMIGLLINAVINLIYAALIAYLYAKCLSRRGNRLMYVFVYAGLFAAFNVQSMLSLPPVLNAITQITLCSTLTLFYRAKFYRRILIPTFLYIIGMTSEVLTELLFLQLNIADIVPSEGPQPIYLLALCVARLIHFLLILLIPIMMPDKHSAPIPASYWVTAIISLLFTYYFNHSIYTIYISGGMHPRHIQMIALLFIFNLFVLYIFGRMSNAYINSTTQNLMNNQYAHYIQSFDQSQQSNSKLTELQHEAKNILANLKLIARGGDIDQIMEFVDSALGDAEEWADNGPCHSGNETLDNIINYVIREASNYGVKIDVNTLVPPDLKLNPYPILTILSNAVKNSAEACQKLEEPNRTIFLYITLKNKQLFINVENQFDGVYFKNERGDFISIKRDGFQHGIGLNIIKKMSMMYKGYHDINIDGNRFRLLVVLNLDGMSNIDEIIEKEMST